VSKNTGCGAMSSVCTIFMARYSVAGPFRSSRALNWVDLVDCGAVGVGG
jgi:hypothetical protein